MRRKKEERQHESATQTENIVENQQAETTNLDKSLKDTEKEVLKLLTESFEATHRLAEIRLKCKLSNSRVSGVSRELKELIKVMSVYL